MVHLACLDDHCTNRTITSRPDQGKENGSVDGESHGNLRHCPRGIICLISSACVGQVLPGFWSLAQIAPEIRRQAGRLLSGSQALRKSNLPGTMLDPS
jgi:hypothetical protein